MIQILKMTATFGRLNGDTLELTPGLNIFTAPNEAGKSTWAAFLTAMFYGIDTGERAKKGTLPMKTKYKPWNGKPMEGVVELLWNGRGITIQRQSEVRAPMGKFTAYDTATGETIQELTAENCGRTLLGVESSVFIRSAFIGQNAMAVSQDPGLEQKLSGLVTTGEESVSYSQTERRLRDWKNHVRHNKTGYLPEAEEQLAAVNGKLDTIRRVHREDLSLHNRKLELTAQQERLLYIEANLKAHDAQQKRLQLTAAEEACRQAEQAMAEASAAAANLPDPETLLRLQRDLDTVALRRDMVRTAAPIAPQAPEIPDVFRGLDPEQAQEKAAKDAELLRKLSQPKKAKPIWLLSVIFACLMGASIFFLPVYIPCILLACSALSLTLHIVLSSGQKKQAKLQHAQAQDLLQAYGAETPEAMLLAAATYKAAVEQYERENAAIRDQIQAIEDEQSRLAEAENAVLTAVRDFADNIYTLDDAKASLARAVQTHKQAQDTALRAEAAQASLAAIRLAVGDAADTIPAEDFSDRYSLPQVQRQLEMTRQELTGVETTLAQHAGLVQSFGDPAALEAEKQQLEARITTLKERETALGAAMAALEEANRLQRSRFSPQITKAAGEILCRMTSGRYDGLRMEQDLTLHAKVSDDAVTRELLALSGGTGDQLYLALRLAICRLALEEGTPLVLDDALVFFDDTRLQQTMELLKEESESRQILLFSCQSREAEYLQNQA